MFKPEYRAWDEHLKILGKVYFMNDTGADTWEVDYEGNPGEPKTGLVLELFTGMVDKNGVKIFHGDFVKAGNDVMLVVWSERHASIGLGKAEWAFMHLFGEAVEAHRCEVIGNVHQHPGLVFA